MNRRLKLSLAMVGLLTTASALTYPVTYALAPSVKGVKYVIRVTYHTDIPVKPFDAPRPCEAPRAFLEANLPPLDEYIMTGRCEPVGGGR